MSRRHRDTKAILRTIERSEQRSSLFWWMVEHHDELVNASEGRRIIWATFCAEAVKRGLRDTRGEVPSERNARETWRQARIAVAEARGAEAAKPAARPGAIYPSRIPKDWKPEAFRQPAPVPAAQQPGTSLLAAPPGEQEPYDWRKRMAQLRQTINLRSGRKE
jgi:hypothetical protein